MLTLDGNTVVKIVDQDIQKIPRHVFEFVDLEKLEPNADEHFVGKFLGQVNNDI